MRSDKMGYVASRDGSRIFYQVDGPEDGDWIVLSNSLATDMRVWDKQIEFLSATKKVLRYDTRGHGQSDSSSAPYSFGRLTGDLVSVLDHLSIDKVDIIGISLGGMTALAMAMIYPERISRIVCCDARADAPAAYKAMWDANIERVKADGIETIVEPTLQRWFTPAFLEDSKNRHLLDTVQSMIRATTRQGYEGVARCLQSLDMIDALAALKHETLFITGAQDKAAPVDVVQGMCDLTPNAQFVIINDAAHLSNLEQPDQFNDIVGRFFNMNSKLLEG